MKQSHSQKTRRNIVGFEAPLELSEEAQRIAEKRMVSVSAIYRQALQQFISNQKTPELATEFIRF